MHRRELLKSAGALAFAGSSFMRWTDVLAAQSGLRHMGKPQPFDYAWLKGQARALAGEAYREQVASIPAEVEQLDWDQYQAIRYRPGHSLWAQERARFQVRFFHLGLFFRKPVRMYDIVGGVAQEVAYDPAMFNYGKSGLDGRKLPADLGFAGFQVLHHNDLTRDIAAFLGASYFRAVGAEMQFGQSARRKQR